MGSPISPPVHYPVVFWDVFGEQGHPVRTTVSEMGPLLLSRILNLNDVQSGVLTIAFKIADDSGLLLLDFKDIRAMIQFVGDQADQFKTQYGNVSTASIGAIQRGAFWPSNSREGRSSSGNPRLTSKTSCKRTPRAEESSTSLPRTNSMQSPRVYATFLLWMLSELFETLPEVGDPRQTQAGLLL